MEATRTLVPLAKAARATAPADSVFDLIPVDNQDASLEQCAMTGSPLPTVVTGAG
jgi:hypothetical protein